MSTLTVVIASTRPGRAGEPIGGWFADYAAENSGFDVRTVDLAELDLPLLDEPHHPRLRRYTKAHTKAWSELIDSSAALVFVTPEYNHGYPAALKNAIDYLHHEWQYKPVGFVSYGGVAAGTRAVQQLKPVVAAVKMFAIPENVHIPFHPQFITDGVFTPNAEITQGADAMLAELARVEAALRPLREQSRKAA
jgi:NAD(P)H-dependent FMN reductase